MSNNGTYKSKLYGDTPNENRGIIPVCNKIGTCIKNGVKSIFSRVYNFIQKIFG